MIVKGESQLNPKTLLENRYSYHNIKSKYNFLKLSEHSIPYVHDFSLVLTKTKTSCVVACTDYPRCNETITIFSKCD
jgi:hypothetical protein